MRIDIFIDKLLRDDVPSQATESSEESEDPITHTAKYWELDGGKYAKSSTDPVYSAIVDEFKCLQTRWMQDNSIPWGWNCSALRVWVRNNRHAMAGNPELQDKFGNISAVMLRAKA